MDGERPTPENVAKGQPETEAVGNIKPFDVSDIKEAPAAAEPVGAPAETDEALARLQEQLKKLEQQAMAPKATPDTGETHSAAPGILDEEDAAKIGAAVERKKTTLGAVLQRKFNKPEPNQGS